MTRVIAAVFVWLIVPVKDFIRLTKTKKCYVHCYVGNDFVFPVL